MPKRKRCSVCGFDYNPRMMAQKVCSPRCAIDKSKRDKARKLERERRRQREGLKTKAEYLRDAQRVFNRFIRLRDKDLPCISCGRYHKGQWHAGHYLTVKAHPELRYCELNVHAQCSACNNYRSGNVVEYRKGLLERIGREAVEWLEGPHVRLGLTIEEAKDIIRKYKEKIKELEHGRS